MRRNFFLAISIFSILASDAFAQIFADVRIVLDGPVEFVVTDSQGRRSGHNLITNTYYDEIPYAGYGVGSNGGIEFVFHTALEDTSFSTAYTMQLWGTGNGFFTGSVVMNQTWSGKGARFHVVGVIDSNQTLGYVFSYSTDSTVTPTMMKIVTSQIIRQDLDNCHKLRMLGGSNFYNDLGNILTSFEQYLAQSDSISAREELMLFQQTIGSTTNVMPVPNGIINANAWNILHNDAQSFIRLLPVPLPQPFVFEADSLLASFTQAYENGWIGDTSFVNSLNNQLFNVAKNLEKGNITKASAQLANFFNRIQKVYNNTLNKQQKGEPQPEDFVTLNGYNLLSATTLQLLTNLGALGKVESVPEQFTTIQAAVRASQPGTTILVDSGTYNEVVNITSKDSLTLLASGNATIQGIHIAKSSVIDINGFIVDASSADTNAVEIVGAEDSDITIESNQIQNSATNGIKIGQYTVRTRIVNNVIVNNQEDGIDFADGTSGAQYVINNTIVKNGYNGVDAASQLRSLLSQQHYLFQRKRCRNIRRKIRSKERCRYKSNRHHAAQ